MFRKLLSATLLAVALVATASAGISEIRYQAFNQTSALSATPAVTVGSYNGTYLACLYLEQPGTTAAMTGTLSWTDENGNSQSFTPTNVQNVDGLPNWSASGCTLARVLANTSLNVAVSGTPNPKYSVSAGGFGLWPGQPQKQGGITEIYNSEPSGCYEASLSPGLYLVAVNNPLASGGYVSWIDDFSGTDTNEASIGSGLVMMFRLASATFDNFFACPESGGNVSLISLGIPATGSGPLIDYEWNVPNWTSTSRDTTILEDSNGPLNIIAGVTIAEQPNTGGVSEQFQLWNWSTSTMLDSATADDTGGPARFLDAILLPTDANLVGETFNMPCDCTGSSPTYSFEAVAISF